MYDFIRAFATQKVLPKYYTQRAQNFTNYQVSQALDKKSFSQFMSSMMPSTVLYAQSCVLMK